MSTYELYRLLGPEIFMVVMTIFGMVSAIAPIIIIRLIYRKVSKSTKERYEQTRPLICPYCDSLNQPQFRFCTNCGGDLTNAKKKTI